MSVGYIVSAVGRIGTLLMWFSRYTSSKHVFVADPDCQSRFQNAVYFPTFVDV